MNVSEQKIIVTGKCIEALTKFFKSMNFLLWTFILIFVFYFALALDADLDPTDDPSGKRSGLGYHKDYGTGCEYLSTKQGYLIPRLDYKGNHICEGLIRSGCPSGGSDYVRHGSICDSNLKDEEGHCCYQPKGGV